MKYRRRRAKKKFFTKKRLTIFGISALVILVTFMSSIILGGLFDFSSDEEVILAPVDKESGKINVLIAGLDKSEARTDTIMVATYDLDRNIIDILSIPRDTRMYIGNRYQKINAAHSITKNGKKNGINGTVEAVTRITGIPINYYVEFTFSTFKETIDALGGVEFNVPQDMNYDDPEQDLHIHLKKGQQLLDGDKAEQFVRFRRYPLGDIDRLAAQQNFIKALAEQKLHAGIILRLPELFKTLRENLKTNITLADVTKYAANLMDLSSDEIRMHALPGVSNGTDYGASYWIADMDELKELIQNTFGYDASKITIHSANGSSKEKDVKIELEAPTKSPEETKAPQATASPKATITPKATKTPQATNTPKVTKTPKPSSNPTKTPEVEKTKEPEESEEPVKSTKPIASPTSKATATPKPSAKPTKTAKPISTETPVQADGQDRED